MGVCTVRGCFAFVSCVVTWHSCCLMFIRNWPAGGQHFYMQVISHIAYLNTTNNSRILHVHPHVYVSCERDKR
jgi:hypothetical protein